MIPEDIDAYKEVRQALPMPIAGGEAEYTRFGFRRLLSERAIDIVQPDLTIAGGFTECQRIAAIASAYDIRSNRASTTDSSRSMQWASTR